MPGAYSHLALVNLLRNEIEDIHLPREAVYDLHEHFRYCELGAISLDYPYLDSSSRNSKIWGDTMYDGNATQMIQHGITAVSGLRHEIKLKAFAWLIGYSAHVVADMIIQPTIELKAGPYHLNQKLHHLFELHQDAYSFQKLNLNGLSICKYLESGIGKCHALNDLYKIDITIKNIWEHMLNHTYPEKFTRNPPNIDKWHEQFVTATKFAEEKYRMIPISRRVAINCGLRYPLKEEIDAEYIECLLTKQGNMHFDEIFEKTKKNIKLMWTSLTKSVFNNDRTGINNLANWNLDTGRDENGQLIYWG
jgi:hypothetical protein